MKTDTVAQEFVQFAIECGVLRFGEFQTKAGRKSPYFFNAGLFDSGAKLARLADFYTRRILQNQLPFDMIFGLAYKGIPLASALALSLAQRGYDYPFAYNRKEIKDHGEGGSVVGATLAGRVLIVDDVMSAGTAIRESITLLQATAARPHAVAVALDRQEMTTVKNADGHVTDLTHSAMQYVRETLGLTVCAIATLDDLLGFLKQSQNPQLQAYLPAVTAYRARYGVAANT